MLCINSYLLYFAVLICSVIAAPRRHPFHGPYTRGGGTGRTTTSSSVDVGALPTNTIINPGGEVFYAQTTMPVATPQQTLTYEAKAVVDDDLVQDEDEVDTSGATTTTTRTGPITGSTSVPAGAGSLQCYQLASEFPPSSQWVSLQRLIDTSRPDMVGSSNDGPDEADAAIAAVQSVAKSAGIDPRIPFAMMMQESSGKVRPIIGDGGKSYGLFQVQAPGIPLCDDYAKNECPEDVITTQVEFGIFGHAGTGSPVTPGIAYWLEAQGGNVGRALRGYNTGNVPDPSDLTQAGGATTSYVSDVANRLTGALVGAKHQATCP